MVSGLKTTGLKEVIELFEGLDIDPRDYAKDARDRFVVVERKQFASGGKSGASGKWQGLSKAAKEARGHKSPLIKSGALRKSLTSPADPNFVFKVDRNSVIIGSSLKYAAYHQRGLGVPRRPVVSLTTAQIRSIFVEAIEAALADKLEGGR